MNRQEILTIIDCLPRGRTKFYYFKDRYAAMLLSCSITRPIPVSAVKKSAFAKLLDRQSVRELLRRSGDGVLYPAALEARWPRNYECYLLTLDVWGKNTRWIDSRCQMTRCGYNLVLQLNFSQKHDRLYHQLVQPMDRHPFENDAHPIAQNGRHTLAWARLDINLDEGEALIEEIQNDWIRDALRLKQRVELFLKRKKSISWTDSYLSYGLACQPQDIVNYVNRVLAAHISLWDEAMLAAAIWFLFRELGIRTIYCHTFDTGNKLKNMRRYWSNPPRSVYTRLPRKFCFERTDAIPFWIIQNRKRSRSLKKLGNLALWRLTL